MFNQDENRKQITALKGGDHAAFEAIFHMYCSSLKSFALKELKSQELAEDAVQEVFTRLWLHRENLDDRLSLRGFLFTCLKNYILNAVRTRNNEILKNFRFASSQLNSTSATEHVVLENEIQKGIDEMVDQLPELRRKIITLSLYQGMSNEQIANELNLSLNTVKMYLSQSSRQLKNHIHLHGAKLTVFPLLDLFY
jgi:RNA polymerase sigma-70 factor (ECF subfamily)